MQPSYALCGTNCRECEAYLATQSGVTEELERVAKNWREGLGVPGIDAAYVVCDGCVTGERHSGYCADCAVRACGIQHGVASCAYCPEFACEKIEKFFDQAPKLRFTLEELRSAL